MRKVFQHPRHKKLAKRRLRRKLKKNKRRNKRKRAYASSSGNGKRDVKFVAPANFSIINNTREMLSFLNRFADYARRQHPLTLDLSEITNLTPDALLYLLSIFDILKQENKLNVVRGNLPEEEKSRKLFVQSGFLKYVRSSFVMPDISKNILSIEVGSDVSGSTAGKLVKFVKKHLHGKGAVQSRQLYQTIVECMANTNNHAYKDVIGRWRLIAVYDDEYKRVRIAFLDNGMGMPHTIRVNFVEKIKKLVGRQDDSGLIVSALRGEFRTSTKLKHRGCGLPAIYDYHTKKQIENVEIMSSYAHVKCEGLHCETLKHKFEGTLLCWDFVK